MSPASAKTGAYHHGSLREALIDAAFVQVAKGGYESVSFVGLAKAIGVSQPACYRHFADKDALLATVAAAGFRLFGSILREAMAAVPAPDKLKANARAYVGFGRAHAELYRLMFGSRYLAEATPGGDLAVTARASFEILLEAVEAAPRGGDSVRDAVGIWASLHGVVGLDHYRLLAAPRTRAMAVDDIVDDIIARRA